MSSVDRFIEQMGILFQDQGDPRIAGRLLGLLLVEGRELSLSQLSERLAVSRASVSTNARMLAKRGAIQRRSHAGDRQDYYELNTASYADMVREMSDKIKMQASMLETFVEPVRAENAPAADRITDMTNAFVQVAGLLSQWAEAMRNEQTSRKEET